MITIEKEVTLKDIDEAISNIYRMLKTDVYGNRMDWRKKAMYESSIDDLLDARNNLVKTGNALDSAE